MRRPPAPRGWLAACCLAAAPAHAAPTWGGALVLTSDAVFRGVSQSGGAAAAQLDLHARCGGWFAGVWTSTSASTTTYLSKHEVNAYAGGDWALSDRWAATARYVRYLYPGSAGRAQYDYDEVAASLRYADRLVVQAAYAPDVSTDAGRAQGVVHVTRALEVALRQPAWQQLAIVASVGRYETETPRRTAYLAWSAGLVAPAAPLELTLSRFGVDRAGRRLYDADAAHGRWVLTAAWRF